MPVCDISVITWKLAVKSSYIDTHEDGLDDSQLNEHGISDNILEITLDKGAEGHAKRNFNYSFLDSFLIYVHHILLDLRLDLLIIAPEVLRVSLYIFRGLVVYDGHEVISWIAELGAGEFEVAWEIVSCIITWALVDESAIDEEDESIEEVIDVGVRLMDGHEDGLVCLCRKRFEVADDDKGCEWVQAWSWLIEHQHIRIADQLKRNRCSLSFSSWYALDEHSSNDHIKAFLKF